MTYRLICDSCTDLPPEILPDPHITKVPLSIQVGPETVVDDETFRQGELLQKMRAWPDAPKTACPAPSAYLDMFLEEGDSYVVTLSGQLSGSYNAAMQARAIYREEGGKGNVHVFNSRSASAGQTQIALLVRELAGRGLPFAQVVERVEAYIGRMRTLFVLENLDNLRKNGRLTRMQSLVTGALRVKLVMGSTPQGEIMRHGQALSIKQALNKLCAIMSADERHRGQLLCISHCLCRERAEYLRALAFKTCDFADVRIEETRGISSFYANSGGIVAAY